MSPDAVLLRQLISFNEPAAPVAIPAVLGLYWIYGDKVLLILALSIVPTFVLQRFAVYYARQDRVSDGVTALAAAIWCPTLAMAIFAPALWALTAGKSTFTARQRMRAFTRNVGFLHRWWRHSR